MGDFSAATVTDVAFVRRIVSPAGRRFEMQDRKTYGLSFCQSGQIIYTMDGKRFVSDRQHAVLLPRTGSYSLSAPESGVFPTVDFSCTDLGLGQSIRTIPLASPDSYLALFGRLEAAFLPQTGRARCMSILYEMLDSLDREQQSYDPISPALSYLDTHFADSGITNSQLAALCRMSEVYFRQCFLRSRGETPRQYLISLRIRAAQQLLASRNDAIGKIAEECGFSSIYHFCRAFKNVTGQTPTEYRAQQLPL